MTTAPKPLVTKRYYTPAEFAVLAHISDRQVYAKIADGTILAVDDLGPLRIPIEWAEGYFAEIERAKREAIETDRVTDARLARRGRVVR